MLFSQQNRTMMPFQHYTYGSSQCRRQANGRTAVTCGLVRTFDCTGNLSLHQLRNYILSCPIVGGEDQGITSTMHNKDQHNVFYVYFPLFQQYLLLFIRTSKFLQLPVLVVCMLLRAGHVTSRDTVPSLRDESVTLTPSHYGRCCLNPVLSFGCLY